MAHSYREQKKYMDYLKSYQREFTREEADLYKMFTKMHKDDEDFDSVNFKKLKALYDKYNKPVDKSKYDKYFKK